MSTRTSQPCATVPITPRGINLLRLIFVVSLASSALLMFIVQPMVGKTLLPALGGTPQVWNTCMVFFQSMLFAGYLHAHYTGVLLGTRRQAVVHLAVAFVALLLMPFGLTQAQLVSPDSANPIAWLLKVLSLSIGIPVFLVAATAPLLQKWFARSRDPQADDPYFLYAASNCGSLLALIAYPAIVEPFANLDQQWTWWNAGFVFFVGFVATCALLIRREQRIHPSEPAVPPPTHAVSAVSPALRARWLLLSFAPSSLLLGVTTFITTDIAPVPLFWVVPLMLYLITFILAFASKQLIPRRVALRVQAFSIAVLAAFALVPGIASAVAPVAIGLHLTAFFFTALVCHGELVALRPATSDLTDFYLYLSLGGLLGGVFNALIAPIAFSQLIEYPLVLALACALRPSDNTSATRRQALLDVGLPAVLFLFVFVALKLSLALGQQSGALGVAAVIVTLTITSIAVLSFSGRPLRFAVGSAVLTCILGSNFSAVSRGPGTEAYVTRTFFGTYKVSRNDALGLNVFSHGTTVHGVQYVDSAKAMQPAAYYHLAGPFGELFSALTPALSGRQVGVIGLGVGGLACYGAKDSTWTFYEIDPAVEKVARDERFFTFLRDCPPKSEVVIGDARLTLRNAPDGSLALLVIDAFTSDAVPTHLLTREALDGYRRKLAPDGVLAFHISNRHLKLAPVIGNLAQNAGLVGRINKLRPTDNSNSLIASPAELVVLAKNPASLGALAKSSEWTHLPSDPTARVWTDDYVNILRALF